MSIIYTQNRFEVTALGRRWTAEGYGSIIRADGGVTSFSEAKAELAPLKSGTGDGVKAVYSDFPGIPGLKIECRVWQDPVTEDVIYELIPLCDAEISDVLWPCALSLPAKEAITLLPLMRGCLVPNYTEEQFPHNWPLNSKDPERGLYTCSRSMNMQFYGQYDAAGAYAAIFETRYDGGLHVVTGADTPTAVSPRWRESLGKIGYTRRLRLHFLPAGSTHNEIAKTYRQYLKEIGELVTLKEKIVRNPKVAGLIGSPIVHTHIWYHIQPDSAYYKPGHPEINDREQSFAQVAEGLSALSEKGLKEAVLHLDGWCRRGYDNQHPDVLPPAEHLGGWEGMRMLQDTCHRLHYFFGLHDQYRDYYYDADSFDEENAVHQKDGSVRSKSFWFGGKQSVLCQILAPDYVKRNYGLMAQNGVYPDNVYLDVFTCASLDECFHPEHPATRAMCADARKRCFTYLTGIGAMTQSETGIDWAFPYLDFVHHAPHAPTLDWGSGKFAGTPVPLLDLVYHDCVVIPWCPKESFLQEKTDFGSLYTLLSGSATYIPLDADEATVQRTKIATDWQKKVQMREMTKFEVISSKPLHIKTYFEGGYSADVNFETGTYILTEPEKEHRLSDEELGGIVGGSGLCHPSDRDKPGYHIIALYYDKNSSFHREYYGDYWTVEEGEADRQAVVDRLTSEGCFGINVYVGKYAGTAPIPG